MTFRQKIASQALAAQREMVRSGELLDKKDFRKVLRLSSGRLRDMVATGSVFAIELDGISYFPSLLATPGINRQRLYAVCRVLFPAPPSCRLSYLQSKHVNLGGLSPIDSLDDYESYQILLRMAHAYAVEWWRTSVVIYEGSHWEEPSQTDPVVTVMDETDPRVNLWKRAAGAIVSGGYISPPGPYPHLNLASVFVALHPAGQGEVTVEARIEVIVDGDVAHALVVRGEASPRKLDAIPVIGNMSVVDVVLRIIKAARAYEAKRDIQQRRRQR
jgi:hypothetical protein